MSIFETILDRGLDAINRVEGEAATFYRREGTSSQAITVVFNEYVGAIDGYRRGLFTLKGSDVTAGGDPLRGDYFILSGQTDRWVIVDVRNDQAGGIEARCDGAMETQ